MDTPKKYSTIRVIVDAFISIGTYSVVRSIIRSNVEEPETATQKALTAVGSAAIAKTVSASVSRVINDQINAFLEAVEEAKKSEKGAAISNTINEKIDSFIENMDAAKSPEEPETNKVAAPPLKSVPSKKTPSKA